MLDRLPLTSDAEKIKEIVGALQKQRQRASTLSLALRLAFAEMLANELLSRNWKLGTAVTCELAANDEILGNLRIRAKFACCDETGD